MRPPQVLGYKTLLDYNFSPIQTRPGPKSEAGYLRPTRPTESGPAIASADNLFVARSRANGTIGIFLPHSEQARNG